MGRLPAGVHPYSSPCSPSPSFIQWTPVRFWLPEMSRQNGPETHLNEIPFWGVNVCMFINLYRKMVFWVFILNSTKYKRNEMLVQNNLDPIDKKEDRHSMCKCLCNTIYQVRFLFFFDQICQARLVISICRHLFIAHMWNTTRAWVVWDICLAHPIFHLGF